jgi:hypothetical protein
MVLCSRRFFYVHGVCGLGPFRSTSKRHLEMPLSCCSHRPDPTRHASVVRLLLLLFVELFKNHPLRSIYGCCNDLSLMSRLPSSLMPPLIQRSVRCCCRLPLVGVFRLSRTLRSFKLCKLLIKPLFFLCFCCCTISAFRVFYYLGFRFTCYRCILCFFTPHTPSHCSLSLRRYLYTRPLHAITSPTSSAWSGPISFTCS